MNVDGSIYVSGYVYDPIIDNLVPTTYKLYDLSQAAKWTPGMAYGSYGDTNADGVWYLQMVAVYVSNIKTDLKLTATAQ